MRLIIKVKLMILSLLVSQPILALGMDDFFRQTGKIYVVVGTLVLIFVGILFFLLLLERRLKKLENNYNQTK